MSLADWLMLTLVCAAGATSPGPSLVYVLGVRGRHGEHAAIVAALGHGLGVGVYAFCAVFGLAAVALAVPALMPLLECLGGLYLLWLGWRMWPRGRVVGAGVETAAAPPSASRMWLSGFAVAALNPKVMVFFVGVFAAMAPAAAGIPERLAMVLLAAVIDAGWYIFIAMAGGVLATRLARVPVQQVLALLLMLLGGVVIGRALVGISAMAVGAG